MKKTMTSILLTFVTLSMAACSSTPSTSASSMESSFTTDEVIMESNNSSDPRESKSIENDSVSTQYVIGDIILADGSAVKATDLTAINNNNMPIAVIAGFQEDGTAFGVGVHRSVLPLQWAADDTVGYRTRFTDIVCTREGDLTFYKDKEGSDNWDIICSQDEAGTVDAAKNYPAFHFVNTYATTYALSDDYASGWYMPSIAELCVIYQNQEAVNIALDKIYQLDNNAAMDGLNTNWYWSSSQAASQDDYVWFVHYFNGYAGECPKNFTNVHALAVRAF